MTPADPLWRAFVARLREAERALDEDLLEIYRTHLDHGEHALAVDELITRGEDQRDPAFWRPLAEACRLAGLHEELRVCERALRESQR